VDNTTDGPTGLPVIAANDNLTILGNGDTIARSTAAGTPAFRLLDVADGASLTLANLTLQGGLAMGISPRGGAVYSQGALDLNGVTVQNNVAQGQNSFFHGASGGSSAGGGIYSSGWLTLEGGTKVQNNQALGGQGGPAYSVFRFGRPGGPGGNASGGGLYVSGGTATLANDTISSNTAQGGQGGRGFGYLKGGNGGNGAGAGLYAAAGTIILHADTLTMNSAQGGTGLSGAQNGLGVGGGLYIATPATVLLDNFTTAHVNNNNASTSNNDIYGTYNAQPILLVGGFPFSTTAGVAGSLTVTALDSSGNTSTGYRGSVHFSSSDPQAVVTADYQFTAADHGVRTFTATLKTAGTQALTVTDKKTASLSGTQGGIYVNPAAASVLAVSGFPSPLVAGAAGSFTVTAMDPYGNITGYTGTVAFTSSDGQAGLPAAYTFTAGDRGVHTFSATLATAGTQSITAADTAAPGIHGTQSGIVINPAMPVRLNVAAAGNATTGAAFSLTVTALDAFSNIASNYLGTVSFTSTDSAAVLPGSYTFTSADQGVHTFTNGVTLKTAGSQTITATGTAIPAGLVSWWPGEGNANDSAGANNGTLVGGVTFASGEVGQAFNLNGVDGYVNFGSAPAFNVQDFTLDAWVSVDPAQNTGERRVLSRDDVVEAGGARQMYALKTSSNAGGQGQARIEILKDGIFTAVTAPSPLTAGFHHLAATRAGSTLSLYVDGVLVASATTTITGVLSPISPLVLGQVSPAYNGEFFQGLIDEPDVFNRALSPSEIQWIYNAGAAGKHKPITGSAAVTVNAGAAAPMFVVSGFPSVADVAFNIAVRAVQTHDDAIGYTSTVHFTSTYQTATLAADYLFSGADNEALLSSFAAGERQTSAMHRPMARTAVLTMLCPVF
jgi:hypothetical protein